MQNVSLVEYLVSRTQPMSMGTNDGAEGQQIGNATLDQLNTYTLAPPDAQNPSEAGLSSSANNISTSSQSAQQFNTSPIQWGADYVQPMKLNNGRRPSSPAEAVAGARSPEEVLRRLSLASQSSKYPAIATFDPRTAYPGLELSGNVISATFCVPYKIDYGSAGEWVCLHSTLALEL